MTAISLDIKTYRKADKVPFLLYGEGEQRNGKVADVIRREDKWKDDPTVYVRKIFNGSDLDEKTFENEVKILAVAQSKHVVKLIAAYKFFGNRDTHFAIIMDRADADLYDEYITENNMDLEKRQQLVRLFGCLASTIGYLHGIGIRHRDIKPQNILVTNGHARLADFGISKAAFKVTLSTTKQGENKSRTLQYCAPEVNAGGSRDMAADIFSLGAVFLELL
ncbi:kinase-like domain-containing protein, partial [Hyaloscypha finlandica]